MAGPDWAAPRLVAGVKYTMELGPDTPVDWMWADAHVPLTGAVGRSLARANPFRWGGGTAAKTLVALRDESTKLDTALDDALPADARTKRVLVRVQGSGGKEQHEFDGAALAANWIEEHLSAAARERSAAEMATTTGGDSDGGGGGNPFMKRTAADSVAGGDGGEAGSLARGLSKKSMEKMMEQVGKQKDEPTHLPARTPVVRFEEGVPGSPSLAAADERRSAGAGRFIEKARGALKTVVQEVKETGHDIGGAATQVVAGADAALRRRGADAICAGTTSQYVEREIVVTFEQKGPIGITIDSTSEEAPKFLRECAPGSVALQDPQLRNYFDGATGKRLASRWLILVEVQGQNVEQWPFKHAVLPALQTATRPLRLKLRSHEPAPQEALSQQLGAAAAPEAPLRRTSSAAAAAKQRLRRQMSGGVLDPAQEQEEEEEEEEEEGELGQIQLQEGLDLQVVVHTRGTAAGGVDDTAFDAEALLRRRLELYEDIYLAGAAGTGEQQQLPIDPRKGPAPALAHCERDWGAPDATSVLLRLAAYQAVLELLFTGGLGRSPRGGGTKAEKRALAAKSLARDLALDEVCICSLGCGCGCGCGCGSNPTELVGRSGRTNAESLASGTKSTSPVWSVTTFQTARALAH
eukprot:COSAG01_NODE_3747_length_5739_cov_220.026064_2_plen_638_part_00